MAISLDQVRQNNQNRKSKKASTPPKKARAKAKPWQPADTSGPAAQKAAKTTKAQFTPPPIEKEIKESLSLVFQFLQNIEIPIPEVLLTKDSDYKKNK